MRRLFLIMALSLLSILAFAQKDTLVLDLDSQETALQIDSNYIQKYKVINDYTLLGVQYGVALSQPSFDPDKLQKLVFIPINIGIVYTRYGKMFGYMPYFGFQAGIFYTQDAYELKENSRGYKDNIQNAYKATMQVLEVPVMAHFHFDFWKMRLMANVGVYGGYRFTIHREYEDWVTEDKKTYQDSFAPVENRFDYGLKAGGGFALIFDPVEFHINGWYKYSWSNLYQPNYLSQYYYKWAYPTNIVITAGVHFQLTKRVGRTKSELKRLAREEVDLLIEEARKAKENKDTTAIVAPLLDATKKVIADEDNKSQNREN